MTKDGGCPECGREIEPSPRSGSTHAPTLRELSEMSGEKTPWHFKLLMAMLVAYLGWRIIAPFVD
ncbi:MAG: hypothetical protein ACO3FT_01870 [Ilumatobacteraceae bacterium]|jgi:hypothetical protein